VYVSHAFRIVAAYLRLRQVHFHELSLESIPSVCQRSHNQ
jgi:hypothetical protein